MLDLDDADGSPLDLAGLLDNLPGMVYRCRADRVWTLDFVSGGSLELTGYRPDELLTGERRAFVELIVPMDRRAVEVAIEAAVAAGQPYTIEYRLRDREGRIKQVWERGRLVRGEGPSAVLEGFITDVSPLRRAEHDLRERIKEMACLYDVSSIAGADLTLDEALWRIAERLPGGYCYPPEIAARIVLDESTFAAPQFVAQKPHQSAPIVLANRVAGAVEVCRIVGDEPVPEDYFQREEQDMLIAVAARIADRVERAGMVAALQASERRARDLYEHLPVPTVVWRRRDGGYVLVGHNRAALVATEGRARGWIGRDCRELLPDRPDLVDALAACVGAEAPSRREIEYTLPDGRALVLAVALGFVPPDLVLAHVVDVTRERSVERRFQEAQKMEVLGRMAAAVAHDFNNFLTVILGYANMFAAGAAADGAVRVELADVEEIRTVGQRAAALTSQLLTFSRSEPVRPEPIDMSAKLRELRGVLARLIGEDRKLTFALAGAPCTVELGAGQLDQILVNLVVNARDATCPGGQVIIVTADVPATEAARLDLPPEPHVVLTVSDDGCGMDAATRRRIFEPFFTTKAPGLGTGMGLAIVYGIVRQAGGRIAVESEPRRGATFRVYLPRAPAPAPAPDRTARGARRPGAGGETILVIEDDEAVLRLVARVLAGARYRVLTASDAAEALVVCERHGRAIDLLITDLVLPWTSGTALAAQIAALCPAIRVLFMSGYAERARQAALAADTAGHFIAKPFTSEALLALVGQILGGERTTP